MQTCSVFTFNPVDKYLSKVSKMMLKQCSSERIFAPHAYKLLIALTLFCCLSHISNCCITTTHKTELEIMAGHHCGGEMFHSICFSLFCKSNLSGLEITGGHHCGGETLQSIFSWIGWKCSEKSLLNSDDRLLFSALTYYFNFLVFQTLKAFIGPMIKKNKGHIVTIASVAGYLPGPQMADYVASKFGAVGLHESLQVELLEVADNIKTTEVCPWFIKTGMFEGTCSKWVLLFWILMWNKLKKLKGIKNLKAEKFLPKGKNGTRNIFDVQNLLWETDQFQNVVTKIFPD